MQPQTGDKLQSVTMYQCDQNEDGFTVKTMYIAIGQGWWKGGIVEEQTGWGGGEWRA